MSEQKRFENWEEVDCNDCVCYWDNSCDGVKEGTKKPCNSFVASRKVSIPGQIKELQDGVKQLRWSLLLTDIIILLYSISYLIGVVANG